MGILKQLTEEYFGKNIRKEDFNIKNLFEKNIGNRDFFVSILSKKGWGKDSKDFLIFDEDTTFDDVIILDEKKAKEFLKKEGNEKFNVVSLKTYSISEETYFEKFYIPRSSKGIEDAFKKICKLYYDYPQVVTYYLLLYLNDYNDCEYNDNLIPFEFNTYPEDEAFESADEFEEGDSLFVFSTTDGIFSEKKWCEPFARSLNEYMTMTNGFGREMEKIGFKRTSYAFGLYPYPTENHCYFYKE